MKDLYTNILEISIEVYNDIMYNICERVRRVFMSHPIAISFCHDVCMYICTVVYNMIEWYNIKQCIPLYVCIYVIIGL